jgi:hypothetical protein
MNTISLAVLGGAVLLLTLILCFDPQSVKRVLTSISKLTKLIFEFVHPVLPITASIYVVLGLIFQGNLGGP